MKPISLVRALLSLALCVAVSPRPSHAGPGLAAEPPAPDPAAPNRDGGMPAPGDTPAGMVIVTVAPFVNAFAVLARKHESLGLVTRLRSVESIRDAYPSGRDDAERIRMFLQDARTHWHIEFALLGGDDPLIPMRLAWIDQLPPFFGLGTIQLPTDQYYACLDGDWNADGDDRWGEAPVGADPRDDPDEVPELCVGRAPVTDRDQAQLFVEKTIRAIAPPSDARPLEVLLAAGLLFARTSDAPDIFSTTAEAFRALIASATQAEFKLLYRDADAWPDAELLQPASLVDALESGPDLTLLFARGGRGELTTDAGLDPSEQLTADALLDLHGRDVGHHACLLSAYTNAPGTLSIGAGLVRARHGGTSSVLGPTDVEFVGLAGFYLLGFMNQGLVVGAPTIGEAMRENLRASVAALDSETGRLTTLGNILLGDPALPFPSGPALASGAGKVPLAWPLALASDPSSAGLPVLPPIASPAPPAGSAPEGAPSSTLAASLDPTRALVRIRFHLSTVEAGGPLEVTVLDLAGRSVRTLARESAGAGAQVRTWDLLDADGARVARGIYFVRVSTRDAARVTKVVVW